jgi:hypothetical protein
MGSYGFDTMMLRRFRRSRVVRVLLCAAGLVSLTAAFGLHPEPSGASATPAPLELASSASVSAPAHECLACLTAASVLVTVLSTAVPVSDDAAIAEVAGDVPSTSLPVASRPPGRAPPAPRSA